MTTKRFYVDDWLMYDNEKSEESIFQHINSREAVSLLNALHEENQLLHKTIEELDNCQKGQSHRINDLYLENKQLKDLIIHLGYTIKYDGYRHISLELKR